MKKGFLILTGAVFVGAALFFMHMGTQMKNVSRADGCPARRVGEETFPTRLKNSKAVDTVFRDEAVKYGTLTVGITITAPVSVGVIGQTFDMDIGASAGELQVEEVLVSAGQQVQKGTPLFRVTSDSAKNIRSALLKETIDANNDYKVLRAKQKELRLQVSQKFDNYVTDGKYAGAVYKNKCNMLQEKANDAKEAVDNKQNQVNKNLLELTQAQQELAEAQKYLREAEIAVSENYSDRYNKAYYYTVYENTREAAESMVGQLEEKVESLTKKNESLLYEVDEASRAYHQVLFDLEQEKLALKLDYDTEIYDSQMASEWYDIQVIRLDNALQDAKACYESAQQRIRAFNAYAAGNRVVSAHNGIILDMMVEAGDSVKRDEKFMTLYDMEAVTIDVSLSKEEYLAVNQEEPVNIVFADHPDEIYTGRIAEASNTGYDSQSENPYYTVTVAVQGDLAWICEGISGDVTFMTKEEKEVLYVPNKAIFKEGDRYYVKVRRKNGDIAEKNVTVGISDGIHAEIVKGLSESDVVLMEIYTG